MPQLTAHTNGTTAPALPIPQLDYVLLDSSISMLDKWHESLSAIDQYIAGINAANIDSRGILHMFYSMNPDYIHLDAALAKWPKLTESAPSPAGTTPLYTAVNLMGLRLRALNPTKCSALIVTDGEASDYGLDQAKAVLQWMRAHGWQITFIGCDFSNSAQARALGAPSDSVLGVQKRLLSDAGTLLARKRTHYALYGTPMGLSADEQTQFGGYLAAQ